ncbi:hypothetical protein ACFL6U_08265 [Planctomycetota bacterium]
MELIELYNKFNQEFFYNFDKHSTDLELEELGKRYRRCLGKNSQMINDILTGHKHPDELRKDARSELEDLAAAEAKFAKEIPTSVEGEHFEYETDFSSIAGQLRGMVEGRSHLVRLVKPSEYERNYWFYTQGEHRPQNIFCSEFGLDMIEYLKAIKINNRRKLADIRRAIGYRKYEVYQFWTVAPYLHNSLMKLGCSWSMSLMTIVKLAHKHFEDEGQPFAGLVKHQLGYDERMPTHLVARIEAMRDISCLKRGEYAQRYGLELPDWVSDSD